MADSNELTGAELEAMESNHLSPVEVEAQGGAALPDKEAMSILDLLPDQSSLLSLNVDLALDADVAAPIDAAVAANVASVGSEATAVADQDSIIYQNLEGTAEANANQTVDMDQSGG